jgi:hypothetical protein
MTIEDFIKAAVIDGRAIRLDGDVEDAVPLRDDAAWLPHGAAVDWSALHARISFSAVHAAQLALLDAEVRRRVEAGATVLVTSVELSEPWDKLPLTKEAAERCNVRHDGVCYRFKRGPPGQRNIAESVAGMLGDVAAQLRSQKVGAYALLTSMIVLSENFDEALHRTAAVHKALKAGGMRCFAQGSCFVPRGVTTTGDDRPWSTIDVKTLGDLTATFVAFAYAVLVHDGHLLGGQRYGTAVYKGQSAETTVEGFTAIAGAWMGITTDGAELAADVREALPPVGAEPSSDKFSVAEARLFLVRLGYSFDS